MMGQDVKPGGFIIRIVIPAILTILLFIITMYSVVIPEYESAIMNRKREMVKELTNSACSILQTEFESCVGVDNDSLEEVAKQRAVYAIGKLRYGPEMKDYFWVTDMHPKMVMHPYRSELIGSDLSDFQDAEGKKMFVSFVEVVELSSEGFVDYMWQWKDDSLKIVPKLSFVKLFSPWQLIVGTGIYIEDVKEEIRKMEKGLLRIILIISVLIALLLALVIMQSLRIERKRMQAEKELLKSREKYKTLVETATEGVVMLLRGNVVYSNKIIHDLLGYSQTEFDSLYFLDLLASEEKNDPNGIRIFVESRKSDRNETPFEVSLKAKMGGLVRARASVSCMQLGEDEVFVLKIREVDRLKLEFHESRNTFRQLVGQINLGVFRTSLGKNSRFLDVNSAMVDILGFGSETDLLRSNIFDLFSSPVERRLFLGKLNQDSLVKNHITKVRRNDGIIVTVAISAVLIKDEEGSSLHCDGILEDVSEKNSREINQQILISELQTSVLFMNQPVVNFIEKPLTFHVNQSISEVAYQMSCNNKSAALVCSELDEPLGIVTDHDLKTRVLAEGIDLALPVHRIMSSPLQTVSERAMLFEAIARMQDLNISFLGVRDSDGKIAGLLSSLELLKVHRHSLSFMTNEIESANRIEEIALVQKRLPVFVSSLLSSGGDSDQITRIIAGMYDAVLKKLFSMAIEVFGEPPCNFAFVSMGSAGRNEQTLATDQDNAIIYEDTDESTEYFSKLGKFICDGLQKVGYNYCPGEIMASNLKWCQPISAWKGYFTKWITTAEPKDLLDVNIFFDLRLSFGEQGLVSDLKRHIKKLVSEHPSFLIHLTNNYMLYRPPLNIFGNIVLVDQHEHPNSFDIKLAMTSLVNMARIYSLKNDSDELNTIDRFNSLHDVLSEDAVRERIAVYKHLMLLRLRHQSSQLSRNMVPDNFLAPSRLTNMEQVLLKKILGQINGFLSRLSFDFKGTRE